LALAFLVDTANRNQVPLVLGGDVFDKPRVATEVVNMAIMELLKAEHGVFIVPGNHDLPYHQFSLVHESSLGTLLQIFPMVPQIDRIQDAQPFGMDRPTGAKVVFTHQLVFRDESQRPAMAKGLTASELLDAFPDADWIFTGDHHAAWHYKARSGPNVVNPGCMLIHNAADIGQVAKCALIDIDAGSVEWIEIPDNPDNLTDIHLRSEEARVSRVSAFLEKVKGQGAAAILDFRTGLESRMRTLAPNSPVHKALVRIQGKAATEEK